MKNSIPDSCSPVIGSRFLLLAAFLLSSSPALGQSTHAFNSGMNCHDVWKLPDTSTGTVDYTEIPGEDTDYQPAASSPSYTNDYVNGTTTDNVTGLMWGGSSETDDYTWAAALSSCAVTMNISPGYAHCMDWRLPNVRELMSIVDYGIVPRPTINTTAFPGTAEYPYWTSTTYAYASGNTNAWYVEFRDGYVGTDSKTICHYVRCVRGGP